jgi:hypothetical protein
MEVFNTEIDQKNLTCRTPLNTEVIKDVLAARTQTGCCVLTRQCTFPQCHNIPK